MRFTRALQSGLKQEKGMLREPTWEIQRVTICINSWLEKQGTQATPG